MNAAFQKSALSAVTTADQVVTAEGFIDFDTNAVWTGCSIRHVAGGNSFALVKAGLYLVTFNANLSPTAAGDITLQLVRNTVAVPGAEATVTGATGDTYNVSFSKVVRILPNCCAVDNTSILQVQASADATISNANINIVKLA